jgi:hypothetical protein
MGSAKTITGFIFVKGDLAFGQRLSLTAHRTLGLPRAVFWSVSATGASGSAPTVAGFLPPSAYGPPVPLCLAHDARHGSPKHSLTYPPPNRLSKAHGIGTQTRRHADAS